MEKLGNLLIIILFIPFLAFSQNVKLNSGNICIDDNNSYKETFSIVLNDLKSEALRKAGVNEYISEFSTLNTLEKNNQFNEIFYSNFLSSISGTIKKLEILNERKGYSDELNCFFINLEINARVKKYKTKSDPSFKAIIEGVDQSYKSGDEINLKVNPYKSAYVNIFYLGESESSILFPYERNQNTFISNNNIRTFNHIQAYAENDKEIGRLIVVLTKEFYPFELSEKDENGFYTKTTTDEIMSWILSIEPEDRKEYFYELNVFK